MVSAAPVYQWQPATAEIAARAGIAPESVIRFDQNTSPGAPPWVGRVAADAARGMNEYPAADYRPLRRALAVHHGLDDERQVVVGAGADELILLAAKAWLGPASRAAADGPGYAMYRIATLQHGAEFVEVARPLPSLEFPAEALARASATADVTWLCSPHNPLGDLADPAAVQRIAVSAAGVTVIDAAYAEFAGVRHRDLLAAGPGVVVLGTFSKAFGLAGIRVGYALAAVGNAARLDAVRPPGSISTISVQLALHALEDRRWMEDNVTRIVAERTVLADRLRLLGLEARPSAANFLLCPLGDAPATADRLMNEHGLVVRTFPPSHPLADHLRFTVRDPDSHDRLIDALERVL